MFTVTQYAKKHKMTRRGVLKRIERGVLKAKKYGSYWIIEK